MKLVWLVTDKGKANEIAEFLSKFNLISAITFIAQGTASHEILEALSLTQKDKEVIIGFAENKDIEVMFEKLEAEYNFTKRGMGVACAIPLNGITSKTLQHLQNEMLGAK
ncbi:hypothetical protein [Acholeplasma hippikon]|uniref:Nitrogen regulatory protein P-II n=1 Tax=Acholeplasma hippikon TaxID=264636 RepID=A0A449BHT4_9MOLU|nr:hypothetical protein [Acholeplasma hippikon]VEU82008.1 Uncharacterised protein [Acholeplasma hippikon]